MQTSPEVAELFKALATAQGKIKAAVLDMQNPHYKSKYASLSSVRDACKDHLSAVGIAILQSVESSEDGKTYRVKTTLGHQSGQWASSSMVLLIDKNNMQGLGSAISYAKRYSLAAMANVVDDEDDDGNAASAKPQQGQGTPRQTTTPQNKNSAQEFTRQAPKPDDKKENKTTPENYIVKNFHQSVNGKKLSDIGAQKVEAILDWIDTQADRPLAAPLVELKNYGENYLASLKTSQLDNELDQAIGREP
jgi:hypothetical protein